MTIERDQETDDELEALAGELVGDQLTAVWRLN
jgi:hypothetical protein